MQNDLQLLLLILGTVIGAFIVYKSFNERKPNRKAPTKIRREFQRTIIETAHKAAPHKKEPHLQMAESDPLLDNQDFEYTDLALSSPAEKTFESNTKSVEKKAAYEIITLVLIPRNAITFSGVELSVIFEEENYHYGKMNLFHSHEKNDPNLPVLYSIASMVEPGVFDHETMQSESYRGIVLWMVYQASLSPDAFEKMLNDAKRLAEKLNATLCDEKRKQLTVQAIKEIRARIQECSYGESDSQSAH